MKRKYVEDQVSCYDLDAPTLETFIKGIRFYIPEDAIDIGFYQDGDGGCGAVYFTFKRPETDEEYEKRKKRIIQKIKKRKLIRYMEKHEYPNLIPPYLRFNGDETA